MGNTSIEQFKENRNNYLKKEDEMRYPLLNFSEQELKANKLFI